MKKIWDFIKRKYLWVLGGLALVLLLVWYFYPTKQGPQYEYLPVTRGSLRIMIDATGSVVPEHRLEVKPPLSGRIESIEADQGQIVKQGQVLAWISSTERATLMDAARAIGPKEVEFWKDVYKPAPLVAPLDGLVIVRNIVPGQVVTTDTAFVMSDRLIVEASVDETDLAKIAMNQSADITLDAFSNEHFTGKVFKIAYDSVTTNNVTTYKVDLLFDDIKDFVRSGMTASVSFEIAKRDNVILIPADTLGEHHKILVAKQKDGKPEERQVKTGLSDGKSIEVISGLQENEWIVRKMYQVTKAPAQGFSILPSMRPSRSTSGRSSSGGGSSSRP